MSQYTFSENADWLTAKLMSWEDLLLPNLPESQRRVLELGSYEGRSACWFLDNVIRPGTTDELVCVDHWVPAHAEAEKLFDSNTAGRATKVKQDALCYLMALCLQQPVSKFDIIYVDAGHDARETLCNAVLAWRLLKQGGVMIFDDYRRHPPTTSTGYSSTVVGIDAFLRVYELELSVMHKQRQVFVQKRPGVVRVWRNQK